MPFSREVTSKQISSSTLIARNRNINLTGLAYGDSRLFVADAARPAVYTWNGIALSPFITRGQLRSAAVSAARRFGDSAPTARLGIRIGGVAYVGGSSKIVVGDTGNGYLLYFNHQTGVGDSSRHIKISNIPTSARDAGPLNPVGLAGREDGDSFPFVFSNKLGFEGIFARRLVSEGAVFRTTTYTTTTYKERPVQGTRTEYRVTGDRASGSDSFSCADIRSSDGEFRKNRTRYRGQSGWSTSRTAAINSSRTTEAHRVKYTTGCGTGANVCYLPGNCGTTTRTVTTTRTTTVTTTKQVPTTTTTQVQIQRQTTTTRSVPTTTTVQTTRTTTRTTSGTRTTTTTVNTTRTTTRTTTTTTIVSEPYIYNCTRQTTRQTCSVIQIPLRIPGLPQPFTIVCTTVPFNKQTTCQGTRERATTTTKTVTTTVNTTRQTTVTKTGTRTTTTTVPATRTTTRYTTATIPKTTTTTRTVTRPTTKTVSTTTTRTVTTTTTRAASGSDRPYANIPSNFSTYAPVIATRQVTGGVGTERVLTTTTRTRTVQVSAGTRGYKWVGIIFGLDLNTSGILTHIRSTGGIAADSVGGYYFATASRGYYFQGSHYYSLHDLRRYQVTNLNIPSRDTADGSNPKGIAWDGQGLYVAFPGRRLITYYRREDIIASIRSGEGRIEARVRRPPIPPFHRIGDSRDIDLTTISSSIVPSGLAHDGTHLFVGDRNSRTIYRRNTNGTWSSFFHFSSSVGNVSGNIDSLSWGDSVFWVGDDVNKRLIKINGNGDTAGTFDIPNTTAPVGIAHLGDTGTLPYIVDGGVDKKVLAYETRTIINPPTFGDSFENIVNNELFSEQQQRIRYRIHGDSEIAPSYISCGDSGDSFNYTTKRWRESNTPYETREEAIAESEYSASFRSYCTTRSIVFQEEIQTTKVVKGDSITQYRVMGDRKSGSTSFSCNEIDTTAGVFRKTIRRYRGDTSWYSGSQANFLAQYNSGYGDTFEVSYTTSGDSSGCFVSAGVWADIPETLFSTYEPIIETRQIPGPTRTTATTRLVTRSGTRTSYLLRRFAPIIQEVGDTIVVQRERQRTTKRTIRVRTSPGSEFQSTDWFTKISNSTLRNLNLGIRPTGLSFGPNGNLFLVDANNDVVYFFYRGSIRREGDQYYDLSQASLRGENFNIFPGAIAWDHSDGFYVSDTQANKLLYFRFYPEILATVRSGIGRISAKAEVAGAEVKSGEGRITAFLTRYIHPTIRVRSGEGRINTEAAAGIAIKTQKNSGDTSRIEATAFAVETKFAKGEVRSGSGRIDVEFAPRFQTGAFVSSNPGEISVLVTRQIFIKGEVRSGSGRIDTIPHAYPPIGTVEIRSGDSSRIEAEAEKRGSHAASGEIRSGRGKIEAAGLSAVVLYPTATKRSGDSSRIEAEATVFVPTPIYISAIIVSGNGILRSSISQQSSPNLPAEYGPTTLIPLKRSVAPSINWEIGKYRATGQTEIKAERTVPSRPRTGDTYSEFPFPFPVVNYLPLVTSPVVPQPLPPTLVVRQQGNQVILRWNQQAERYTTRAQLQVSENEQGPWFAVDTSGNGGIRTGDSGGFTETDGFEEVLSNVPLKGTQEIPEPRALCYRVRRVDDDGQASGWSNAAMVEIKPIVQGQIGAGSVGSTNFVSDLYGNQGAGNKLAYWSLDDTLDGRSPFFLKEMQDTSQEGPSIPLKVSGPYVRGTIGKSGRGLALDGHNNGSYLITPKVGDSGEWNSFTMLGIFKGDSTQPQSTIGLLSYWSASFSLEISYVKRTSRLRIKGTGFEFGESGVALFNDEWRQVVLTLGDSEMGLWLDGGLLISKKIGVAIPQGGFFGVGGVAGNNTITNKINGEVDEIRLWNRALSQKEITYFNNFPGGGTTDIITNSNFLPESIDATKVTADFFETGFARVRNSIQIGQPINVESGNLRTHADADEFSLQKYNGTNWENEGSFFQNSNGAQLEIGKTTISGEEIKISEGATRWVGDNEKIVFSKLIDNRWLNQTKIEGQRIVFYNENGEETRVWGSEDLNVGNRILFNNFIVSQDSGELNFQGTIKANSIGALNRFINQTITQRDLFLSLARNTGTWTKIHGTGFLNDNVGGNQLFEGNLVLAERKSGTLFYLHCINTKTKQAQILKVNSHLSIKVFDVVTMEF